MELDRDPLGGLTPEEFVARHRVPDPDGGPGDWDWPDDGGAVAGTRGAPDLDAVDPDRIDGPDGSYFGRDGDPFHLRSVPPDRLSFPRASFDIDLNRAQEAGIRAEQSRVAPAFEQPGGGTQYQFLQPGRGTPLSQRELEDLGVLSRRTP